MSYRPFALASCLLMVGCGGAAPPPAAAEPHVSPDGSTALGAPGALDEKPAMQGSAPNDAAPPPARSGANVPEGKGAKDDLSVRQAVVQTPEPLGGKLTQADIGRIVEQSGDVFGDCYTLGAGGKMKDFKGVVTVKATIGPSGTVNQVDVTKSTANNTKVDACVRDAFKKIKFPKPRDGATSVITFPISFNGVEQVQ